MATGKVKWFNDAKGYGFISIEGETRDVFVHYSSILSEGYRSLAEGEAVDFDLIEGTKGLKADKVHRQAQAQA